MSAFSYRSDHSSSRPGSTSPGQKTVLGTQTQHGSNNGAKYNEPSRMDRFSYEAGGSMTVSIITVNGIA